MTRLWCPVGCPMWSQMWLWGRFVDWMNNYSLLTLCKGDVLLACGWALPNQLKILKAKSKGSQKRRNSTSRHFPRQPAWDSSLLVCPRDFKLTSLHPRFPRSLSGKEPAQESQETQAQSLSQEDPLEKEMETHSRIIARVIPWTEEPGRL